MLAPTREFDYEAFIVHASADKPFVQGYLLPELGLVSERVLVLKGAGGLEPGQLVVNEIERGVRTSRVTIVVLSPAYKTDHWAVFGEQLAAYAQLGGDGHGTLLPLLREDCDLPSHIRAIVKLDFRDSELDAWKSEATRLRAVIDRPVPADPDLPCPYPGMRSFGESDAARFFGREAELEEIVGRLRYGEREIYVIGASGSGKSSLVAAGLTPRLTRGGQGLPGFVVRSLRPGDRPLARLGQALEIEVGAAGTHVVTVAPASLEAALDTLLARQVPATSLLLVVDQLEELFAVAAVAERAAFTEALRVLRADRRCVLVFTLRADFFGAFMDSALWSDLDGRPSRVELGPLGGDSLRAVIERPARDLGVYLEPDLIERLLADTATEPGALPLLQAALEQLWQKRRHRLLTLADYQMLGNGTSSGLALALAKRADTTLRQLGRAQEAIALRILLRLVNFGEGRADTRRQQARGTLHSEADQADFDAVLQRLVADRLVTVTGDAALEDVRVDLAHEILIVAWPALAEWIATWRAHEQRRREIEAAASAWRSRGGGDGGLLDAVEHAATVTWRAEAGRELGLSADVVAFIVASEAFHVSRRRALVLSVGAAVAIAIAGSLLFVRNIAVERDRADASGEVARRARASAEASLDELTLKHAQLLLTTDPSAAIDALRTYHGADLGRAEQIRAEATGRGVAVLRARPHTSDVLWTEGASDGAIFSLSTDGTISRTSLDGRSAVLVRGVSKSGLPSYSRSRHLLAYACDPSDICLFDVVRAARVPVAPMLRGVSGIATSLSPDGTLLALLSQEAVLRILDVTDPAKPVLRLVKSVDGAVDVDFVDDHIVVVGTMAGIEFVRANGGSASEMFAVPDISRWSAGESKLAIATAQGKALVLASFPARVVAHADLCHGPIADLKFILGRGVAYGCREGAVGIWDLQRGTVMVRAQLEGHADRITASPSGDYIVASGGNGTVIVLDLYTDLIASYRGHGLRVTSITPPTPEHPFLISADVRGAVRTWPVPVRLARVAATSSSSFYTAIFNQKSTSVTATTWLPALTVFAPPASVRAIAPHEPFNIDLEQSDSGRTFVTYGLHDLVEVWAAATMTRTRVITTGHGSTSQLRFVDATEDFITSGHDGRLVRWTPAGRPTLITQFNQPIDNFAVLPATGPIVFSTADGALWRTDGGGHAVSVRGGGSRVNRILAAGDHQTVYAGYADGDVVAVNTKSWQHATVLHGSGSIQEIAITSDGHTLAVATNDGMIHVGTRNGDASAPGAMTWGTLAVSAHHITLTSDGLLVAACTDGTIWLYATARRHSLCLPTGTTDFGRTTVTADGTVAVVLDREGRLLWIDLASARKLLGFSS